MATEKTADKKGELAEERLVYTVPEAGKLLRLSRNGAYLAAKRGDLPTVRIGGLVLVPRTALMRMLDGSK
jgi:excisionase family DNA binding protein